MTQQNTPSEYKPSHIANYFLDKSDEDGYPLTPMKLIKLVYFAYGWASIFDKKLFDEPIEAWSHGPVIPSLYHAFKKFGGGAIHERALEMDIDSDNLSWDLDEYVSKIKASDDAKGTRDILDFVWKSYKEYTGSQLRNLTHRDGTPWHKVYEENCRYKRLKDDDITNHFKEKYKEYSRNDQ